MKRKDFLHKGIVSGALLGTSLITTAFNTDATKKNGYTTRKLYERDIAYDDEVVIERSRKGKPHAGKVLLAIQAHSDDIPLFAGGLVAKLMDEGYKGYLLRTSDDSKGDPLGNEVDTKNIAKY